jgi:hypothetical protein
MITHTDADRIQRVRDLVKAKEATPGFFIEAFPFENEVQHANERWFFEITKSTIVNKSVQGTWCNADSLTVTEKVEKTLHLGNAKDYGPRSLFMQE